jgi:phosphohistidine phosphatase
MNLYLVRHADYVDGSENAKRPLSEKGWGDIRKVANFVANQLNINVDAIYHSGKLRAKQTAEVMGDHIEPSRGLIQGTDLKPMDDPSVWFKKLANLKRNIMLVSHLPILGKLAGLLICNDADREVVRFQTSEVVCLKRDDSGVWLINWVINPEDVK